MTDSPIDLLVVTPAGEVQDTLSTAAAWSPVEPSSMRCTTRSAARTLTSWDLIRPLTCGLTTRVP